MGWLYGPRFREQSPDGIYFASTPVRLDVDDVTEMQQALERLGMQPVTVDATADVEILDFSYQPLTAPLRDVHSADIRSLRFRGHMEQYEPRTIRDVMIVFSADGVTLHGAFQPWPDHQGEVRRELDFIRRRVEAAPSNGLPPLRKATIVTGLLWVPIGAVWVLWWLWNWRSWPGILLVGIAWVCLAPGGARGG